MRIAVIAATKSEVDHFEKASSEVKLASGDYIDLKMYEPAMRHLIDTYIQAEDSKVISAFDDLSLVQLIVERGVEKIPEGYQFMGTNQIVHNSLDALVEYHEVCHIYL